MALNITCEDNMKLMGMYPDNYFDLAIVDPPYFDGPDKLGYYGSNITKSGVKRKGYKCKHWDIPKKEYFQELTRVSKDQIIWGCNYYAEFIKSVGRIVWDKVNVDSSFSDCEIASCSLHDSIRMFSFMWNGFMQGKSIIDGKNQIGNKKNNEKRIHPTQKPVKLYEWLLINYAKEGDKILDTHGGSMSIAIACANLGFDLTLCELDEEYYNKGVERIKCHIDQLNIFQKRPELILGNDTQLK